MKNGPTIDDVIIAYNGSAPAETHLLTYDLDAIFGSIDSTKCPLTCTGPKYDVCNGSVLSGIGIEATKSRNTVTINADKNVIAGY